MPLASVDQGYFEYSLAQELGLHPNQVYGSYGGTTTSTLAVMELASSDASDHFQGTRLNNVVTAAIELKLKEGLDVSVNQGTDARVAADKIRRKDMFGNIDILLPSPPPPPPAPPAPAPADEAGEGEGEGTDTSWYWKGPLIGVGVLLFFGLVAAVVQQQQPMGMYGPYGMGAGGMMGGGMMMGGPGGNSFGPGGMPQSPMGGGISPMAGPGGMAPSPWSRVQTVMQASNAFAGGGVGRGMAMSPSMGHTPGMSPPLGSPMAMAQASPWHRAAYAMQASNAFAGTQRPGGQYETSNPSYRY